MRKTVITILAVLPHLAFGACGNISCDTTIDRVYATGLSEGLVYIKPEDNPVGAVNCVPAEDQYFTLKSSHPLFSEIYSMALSSMMAGKDVRLRIVEGTDGCELAYMWVSESS